MRNIDIGKDHLADGKFNDISYQSFSRMASFYGRFMEPHRHDGYYQIHYLDNGYINLSLDDQANLTPAVPVLILTPPSIPHAFYTTNESTGHVLTVRDEIVRPLIEKLYPRDPNVANTRATYLSLKNKAEIKHNIDSFFSLISSVSTDDKKLSDAVITYLVKGFFTYIFCHISFDQSSSCKIRGELALFQNFKQLIEENYTKQIAVPDYAKLLDVTESRLKDMCRRFSGLSPKRLIFERVVTEAKRQLLYTDNSISTIALNLGFADPSYFARFFIRNVGLSPSQWQKNSKNAQVWK